MSEKKNMSRTGIQPGTFKRLMAYLFSHYRVHLITVIICIIVTAVASVGQTVYIQILIDQCILPGVESGMDSVWPQMRSISRIKSWAAPKRVSVAAPASETMGSTSPYLDCTRSSTSMAWLYVQKEPQKANPIFLCSMFTLLIR